MGIFLRPPFFVLSSGMKPCRQSAFSSHLNERISPFLIPVSGALTSNPLTCGSLKSSRTHSGLLPALFLEKRVSGFLESLHAKEVDDD